MAEKFVSPVEAGSIGPQQPFHAVHQIGFWRFDHEMEMITHEAPGMDLPVGFGARLTECSNEQLAILVATEDIFAMIAPVHHVINGPLVLDSEFTSHGETMASGTSIVNTKNRPLYQIVRQFGQMSVG